MRQNLNVPNVLTTLRIVLVPFFGYALLHDHGNDGWWRFWAWAIFAVAMFTDRIDGEIARKHNLITNFGKIADPIADKAITGMAFIGLSITGDIWWSVTIVVLVREWAVTILRLSILKKVVLPADRLGKLKTLLQVFALGLLVLPFQFAAPGHFWHTPGHVLHLVWEVLLGAAVAMTLWSGAAIFRSAWQQRHLLR
ncbi:CDP-diacylglycerol--glycerol-3-phosphate 3-phosphatidyltransferase [Nocardioides baekrokdamisoli]|uniref:CDP-diacylglycerol--glycerol-3-phosphate 3-phosphatidyltransferase n=1 Tax=Nocardioides baekrokdamisoli TaxID=1804624 RepID=A0A3G9IYR6_9ACTN|nr:CDP-diacylglycerol--glycerol-3-phosphate 3-phosphatidyltransferase [Nocardioides baekrokdamisoli]BBH15839.1 CDP-diacylglycerol--glycerol-3-phosphate 3-phosphatidyltransferase [Nocardioides baekrokdamisoli]